MWGGVLRSFPTSRLLPRLYDLHLEDQLVMQNVVKCLSDPEGGLLFATDGRNIKGVWGLTSASETYIYATYLYGAGCGSALC